MSTKAVCSHLPISKTVGRSSRFYATNIQLCLGQKCGIEHAIHSLRHSFDDPENEAILLIDAKNDFNVLNRRTALENVKTLCPSLHVALQNSDSHPSHLYIGKLTILSQEGTTQGDSPAMAMYGIAILPLITRLHNDSLTQKWYADDGSVDGKLKDIRALFDKLTELGPKYGYLVNPPKCQLIIKPGGKRQASIVFASKNFLKMQKLNTKNFRQTWSICSHLSPECLCMFDEEGSIEVELPLAYYTLHG